MKRPEQDIQKAVVLHLRQRGAPGLVFTHPANGGFRTSIEGAIFKSLGMRPGVSDLLLWRAGKFYALEIKARDGRLSPLQAEFIADIERAGGFACCVEGVDAALRTLEAWGLLRGIAA
jgi:hypothetical protein